MRTTTVFPVFKLSTFTLVPKGSERCAAVIAPGSQRSPDAVLDLSEYHEARPVSAKASPNNAKLAMECHQRKHSYSKRHQPVSPVHLTTPAKEPAK